MSNCIGLSGQPPSGVPDQNQWHAPAHQRQRKPGQRHVRTFRSTLQGVADLYPSARVDGFELEMFVASDERGDALVRAPDGSIGTLIWQTGEPSYFKVTIDSNESRWGTFTVQLPLPMTNDDEAAAYLAALLPDLRPRWKAWVRERADLSPN